MKAIRVHAFGGPEELKLEDVPDPVAGPGQVVVAVRAIGINPYEAYIRTGTYVIKPPLPYTPGADAAGVVESVGANVTHVKPGDRVYIIGSISGAYAEKTLCDAKHVCPLPDRISYAQGAGLSVPFGTAYRALFDRAAAKPGETLLVHGATGGVGTAAVQLAISAGVTVIATGGTDAGRDVLRQLGAQHVLDHHDAGYIDEIKRITNQKGVNVVLEMLANVNLQKDLQMLAKYGRVVVIGTRGKVEIDPRLLLGNEASIHGVTLWGRGDDAVATAHAYIGAGLRNGALNPVVGVEMPLADAAKAQARIMESGAVGKIVLIP